MSPQWARLVWLRPHLGSVLRACGIECTRPAPHGGAIEWWPRARGRCRASPAGAPSRPGGCRVGRCDSCSSGRHGLRGQALADARFMPRRSGVSRTVVFGWGFRPSRISASPRGERNRPNILNAREVAAAARADAFGTPRPTVGSSSRQLYPAHRPCALLGGTNRIARHLACAMPFLLVGGTQPRVSRPSELPQGQDADFGLRPGVRTGWHRVAGLCLANLLV
jgi:hypothetical protein